jgi:hypothetical protein
VKDNVSRVLHKWDKAFFDSFLFRIVDDDCSKL